MKNEGTCTYGVVSGRDLKVDSYMVCDGEMVE